MPDKPSPLAPLPGTGEGDSSLEDRRIGRVTVLFGERGGKYPHGNSLLVQGRDESLLIDPSLAVIPRRAQLPRVDRVVNSHCHEDHIAGNHLFPDVPWHLHELDLPGIHSLDNMMAIYGYGGGIEAAFRRVVVEQFHFTPRPDAVAFRDGDVFDLGGVQIRVVHAPGHTRGHCVFMIEPDGILYLGDIDLSSFGPYYGDAWSSLEDFERTLEAVRQLEARWYATFHHIGVLDGRAAFLEKLDRFAAVIRTREDRLLDFLAEPRTLEEIVAHRFVYRPQDDVPFAAAVERRSMAQHLERLQRDRRIAEAGVQRYTVATR
jgi:glyoxylase-like metal-dependent hydrolase (beta-lactamase superfamily II)